MKNDKKDKILSEELKKIKYRVAYKINETPKYRPLVGETEEFDNLPEEGEDNQALDGAVPAPKKNKLVPAEPPIPEFDKANGNEGMPTDAPTIPSVGGGMTPNPEQKVDDIQNEIIRHNIEAMKSIHDQLESLNQMTQNLNAKLESLNSEVEEVREPSNSEKLMSKKENSFPFYLNLNDYWKGNWFEEKRDKQLDKGIKELPDGTYVADFDDLPRLSKTDVQNSFNEY